MNEYTNWIRISEAGKTLGLNRNQAWFLVRTGALSGHQFGGYVWLVDPASVQKYRAVQEAKQNAECTAL